MDQARLWLASTALSRYAVVGCPGVWGGDYQESPGLSTHDSLTVQSGSMWLSDGGWWYNSITSRPAGALPRPAFRPDMPLVSGRGTEFR